MVGFAFSINSSSRFYLVSYQSCKCKGLQLRCRLLNHCHTKQNSSSGSGCSPKACSASISQDLCNAGILLVSISSNFKRIFYSTLFITIMLPYFVFRAVKREAVPNTHITFFDWLRIKRYRNAVNNNVPIYSHRHRHLSWWMILLITKLLKCQKSSCIPVPSRSYHRLNLCIGINLI